MIVQIAESWVHSLISFPESVKQLSLDPSPILLFNFPSADGHLPVGWLYSPQLYTTENIGIWVVRGWIKRKGTKQVPPEANRQFTPLLSPSPSN